MTDADHRRIAIRIFLDVCHNHLWAMGGIGFFVTLLTILTSIEGGPWWLWLVPVGLISMLWKFTIDHFQVYWAGHPAVHRVLVQNTDFEEMAEWCADNGLHPYRIIEATTGSTPTPVIFMFEDHAMLFRLRFG